LPTYEYACRSCGHRLEAVQKFSDDALTVCPDCSGELRKIYAPVGIVLKGSGFYKTDSRANSNGNGNGKKASQNSESSSGDSSGTSTSSDSAKSTSTDSGASSSAGSTSESSKPAATPAS
jgi:putative FmdB family regulatory protein